MPKSLYDQEHYTAEASALDEEASRLLRPLMERYHADGYSIREIASVLYKVVFDLECETVIHHNKEKD